MQKNKNFLKYFQLKDKIYFSKNDINRIINFIFDNKLNPLQKTNLKLLNFILKHDNGTYLRILMMK